jgi:hypothetical protein
MFKFIDVICNLLDDRLCGLVVRVPFYQIFWEVVGPEQGPLSLVSTTEELLGRNSSGSGPEIREYGRRDPLCWPRDTLYLQNVTNFADKQRLLGWHSSLADWAHRVICYLLSPGPNNGAMKTKKGREGYAIIVKYLVRVHLLLAVQAMAVGPSRESPPLWSTVPGTEAIEVQHWRGQWVRRTETLGHNWLLQWPSWIGPVITQ